jgi:putative holliday junction resolvase
VRPKKPGPAVSSSPEKVLSTTAVRAAGIDVGRVRVGVAVADELGLLAHPRAPVDGRDPRRAVERLAALAAEEQIGTFVVGLPRTLKGEEGPSARRARKFAQALGGRTGLPVELFDEWLSTREARARLRDQGVSDRDARERIDSAAAAVVLQAWLDARRPLDGGPDEGDE